ncbi:MAG: ABC transporter ATP-binding protein [Planctomycetaceae bacterium]|nr:MAG: ABC transporter ATP-binding protein [Planctomycetaceae bacterium]
MTEMMIKLNHIQKRYNTRAGFVYVLQQINLTIEEGEFVTIMGPSGAGKTTLLNIIGMLDGEWEGEYYLAENPVHELKPKQRMALNRQYIGFVFQNFNLLDNLTVYENLDVPLSYRNVKSSERAGIVCDTLDRFGIVGKKDLFPSQLSGGQQQLVGVARAIIANPRLLLADEPTGNLHSSQGKDVMDLLKKLNREGTTIIQVTHNEDYAAYGNRIVKLKDGWYDGEIAPAKMIREED